jgi:pimeloyl-ACP methyl ester carboxylesterase
VLRYDDRGVGKSSGKFDDATTADFTQDAAKAVDFLKKHPRVDPKRIGLIGHSEGGLVAPLVANQDDQVAWIVLMAGPGVNGEQIMYSQGRLIILAAGGDEATATRNRLVQEAAFSAASKLKPGETPSTALDTLVEQVLENSKKLEGSEPETGDAENQAAIKKLLAEAIRANLADMNTPWFRFFMAHEPGPVLEQVRSPVLAINGEKDTQVDPKLNLPKIAASLKAGGNQSVTILELASLNHLFQTSQSGSLSEYESIEETIAPAALNTISDWLTKPIP